MNTGDNQFDLRLFAVPRESNRIEKLTRRWNYATSDAAPTRGTPVIDRSATRATGEAGVWRASDRREGRRIDDGRIDPKKQREERERGSDSEGLSHWRRGRAASQQRRGGRSEREDETRATEGVSARRRAREDGSKWEERERGTDTDSKALSHRRRGRAGKGEAEGMSARMRRGRRREWARGGGREKMRMRWRRGGREKMEASERERARARSRMEASERERASRLGHGRAG